MCVCFVRLFVVFVCLIDCFVGWLFVMFTCLFDWLVGWLVGCWLLFFFALRVFQFSLLISHVQMRRESYNWLVNELGLYLSKVHEFARLQLTHTILSKRKLITLVEGSMSL
jgi:hypothetical protein